MRDIGKRRPPALGKRRSRRQGGLKIREGTVARLRLEFRDTEIENLDGIAATLIGFEPDVIRFKVTVNYSLFVGLVDRRADLFENIEGPTYGQVLFFFEDLAER